MARNKAPFVIVSEAKQSSHGNRGAVPPLLTPGIQLVGKLDRGKSFESGARIVKAAPWLAELDIESLKPPYDAV
jgi:hypothetical protein